MVNIDTGIHRDSQDILNETDKAIRVMLRSGVSSFGSARPVWLPKSQITWQADNGFAETIRIPIWLARKSGL